MRIALIGAPVCFVLVEAMDRELLLEHLKQAERHAAEGRRVLEHQRSIIEHLCSQGQSEHMIDAAERLLRSFEEVQSMHLADIARLRGELGMLG